MDNKSVDAISTYKMISEIISRDSFLETAGGREYEIDIAVLRITAEAMAEYNEMCREPKMTDFKSEAEYEWVKDEICKKYITFVYCIAEQLGHSSYMLYTERTSFSLIQNTDDIFTAVATTIQEEDEADE